MNKRTSISHFKPEDIKTAHGLNPKIDEYFIELISKASDGRLPVYYAAIPTPWIIPFDVEYRPDLHPMGKQLIETYIQDLDDDKYHPLLVYPKGKWFVCPDSYIELFAALSGNPAYMPCYIFGDTNHENVKSLKGPLPVTDVQKITGLTA